MKKVLVKSVFDAFEYVMSHYYPAGMEEMVEKSDTYAVISIQDSHTDGFGITFTENQYFPVGWSLIKIEYNNENAESVDDLMKRNPRSLYIQVTSLRNSRPSAIIKTYRKV